MKKIVLILSLFISINVAGQGEAANWYFGFGAGVQFDRATGIVSSVTNGQLSTNEGCATISDADGNLLFYTDGSLVFNRDHLIMPNGNALFGDSSSTQSAIIVPKPDDPNIYYIFTVDTAAVDNSDFGLNYSVVDMTLDGGLGDITNKNVNLLPDCSEKITAVLKDCVTKSIWVVTLASSDGTLPVFDTYHAFEVNNSGVNPTSVKSTFNIAVTDQRGYLKLSPDGTKMAIANMRGDFNDPSNIDQLLLYDFDELSGIVSNQQRLFINSQSNRPYGVEFSPDSQLLYVHSSNDVFDNNPTFHTSSLTQFNLAAADIQASEFTVDDRQLYRGGLQLGPNGKIYRALSATYNQGLPFLGVINNPNNLGAACNYQHNAISLAPRNSTQGLPPFIQSIFNTEVDIIRNGESSSNLYLCDGDTYTLVADDLPGADYTWSLDGIPLADIDFDLEISQGGHYELYIDPNNGDCPIEGEAFVSYFEVPIANQPSNIIICDDNNDGFFIFDFTIDVSPQVLGAQDPNVFGIHYFETENDALNNVNEIFMPYQNIANQQEIFVRIHNNLNEKCFDTTSFFIDVFNTPIAMPVANSEFCDDASDGDNMNGQTTVDLHEMDFQVLDNQDPLLYNITYHSSQLDADSGNSPLPFNYYNAIPNTEIIYVRIENIDHTNCYDTTSFNLVINIVPEAHDAIVIQCDEDGVKDGFTTFNLTEVNNDLTGGIANRSTKFFLTFADAQNNVGEIDGISFNNTVNPQTIYVQVINDETNCINFSELTLEVSLTNANDAILTTCDDDGLEDGFYSFSLSDADAEVLNGLPPNVTINYYETYNDALLEQNPLSNSYINTVAYDHTIYVRVENDNACYGINQLQLIVYELPDIVVEDQSFYCLNFFPQTITLSNGVINDLPSNYTYLWSTGETTSEIEVNQTGNYSVTVINANGCTKIRTITILPSNIATFESIEVQDVSLNNTVTIVVSGEGEYTFALNDINGPYQESNFFDNVAPGIHTVYVRDNKNSCGIVEQLVSIIGFPKFFTPNQDSYNDTWQVYGLSKQFQPNSKILIFDRYGKLLKELDPLGPGWNGTFNGKGLPSSDYWFQVTLQDGRIFKSHFTLKH